MPVDEKKIRGTTDARVWAEEFCTHFAGLRVAAEDHGKPGECDPELMIDWFANAIETGRSIQEDERLFEIKKEYSDRIFRAINELGVPSPNYPAPVANAVKILKGEM